MFIGVGQKVARGLFGGDHRGFELAIFGKGFAETRH